MIKSLNWLVQLRWIALTAQMIAIPFAIKYTYLSYRDLPFVVALLFVILIFNICCQRKIFFPQALVQLLFDLTSFIGLIILCGKIENPFWDLIYFHIMMAAFVLPKKQDKYYLPVLIILILTTFWSSSNSYTSIMFTFIPQGLLTIGMWIAMRSLGLLFLKQQKTIGSLETKKNLLEKHRQISLLVSGIVHELGTPLNTVRLKVDKLLRDNQSDSKDIDVLDKSVKRLEQTTHQLNLTQSSLDQASLAKLNLTNLVETMLSMIEKEYPLTLEKNIEANIWANSNALNIQLFISNCFQNCADEGIQNVKVNLSKSNGSVLLQIKDNGPGFSNFILENFKAPYNTTKGQGRGLGLYNCALGFEAGGGTLNIYNDNGAVLELYLEGESVE